MKAVKASFFKFEKENKQKPSSYNFDCLFSISSLVYRSILTDKILATMGHCPALKLSVLEDLTSKRCGQARPGQKVTRSLVLTLH